MPSSLASLGLAHLEDRLQTQLLDLLLLAPDLQDQVLHLEAVDGVEPLCERAIQAVAHTGTWRLQRAAWRVAGAPESCLVSSGGSAS